MIIGEERDAIVFLGNALKEAQKSHNKHGKNIFKHSLGVFHILKKIGMSTTVCIGGLLHDIIEDTFVDKKMLENEFGNEISDLVVANMVDKKAVKQETKIEIIDRCLDCGNDALVIKICDIYDSYMFYKKIDNISEMQRSVDIKKIIIERIEVHNEKEEYDLSQVRSILDEIV